jgi:hypothetical protein
VINAPLSTVWEPHTDVERYTEWQQAVATIERLDPGPLREGSQFRWTTPVPATAITPADTLSITSSVRQIEPEKCIRWTGPAMGQGVHIDNGIHVWNFTEVAGKRAGRARRRGTGPTRVPVPAVPEVGVRWSPVASRALFTATSRLSRNSPCPEC